MTSKTMRAACRTTTGLVIRNTPVPVPTRTEILIKVRASSLNRADLYLLDGRAHGEHGGAEMALGIEWAGDVVAVGADVKAFNVGDRVMCTGIGGLAEYAVADWRRAFPIPLDNMAYDAAATLPVALRTTHVAIATLGRLGVGQSVVVLGASSAVGLMSLQVAKQLGASLIIGTSTQAARRAQLGDFGADAAIDTNDASWSAQILALTDGRGADLLIDFLAGPFINDSMRAVAVGGRIVNVGRMAGEAGHFDFDLHSLRRIRYFGTTFRNRSADELQVIVQQVRADFWPALVAGHLRLPIDARFPLEQTADAFEMMRTNAHFGKIVVVQD